MKLLMTLFLILLLGVGCIRKNGRNISSTSLTVPTPQKAVIQVSDDLDEAMQDLELIEDIP